MLIDFYKITRIFAEKELNEYLEMHKNKVMSKMENENKDYLINVDEQKYIDYITSLAKIDPLVIHEEQIYASPCEKMIEAKYFPGNIYVVKGKSYKKSVIKFHIPISGDPELLRCIPSQRILWSTNIEIRNGEFCFEIINFYNDEKPIIAKKDELLKNIMKQSKNLDSEVNLYNNKIENQIKDAFIVRKNRIIEDTQILASLNVPIKKISTSSTFSIPVNRKRKKIEVTKPTVKNSIFETEPCLSEDIYIDILSIIHDVGKEFERLPSLYANKKEEHLRDHFLMMLEPNFEGTATGETFNKKGKTDILLRYKGKNVFVGECKFWHGKSGLISTISQLLGYLTWRDSKAAAIIFVRNKDFTSVIETTKQSLEEHPNYIETLNIVDKTWFNCKFYLDCDKRRIINIAIMLYHLPESD